MDIRMEGMDGLTAAKEIITGHPRAQRFCYLLPLPTDDYIIDSHGKRQAQRDTLLRNRILRQLHLRSLPYTTVKPSSGMKS